ncbi:hypothetical protein NUU61_009576 [Penicillium alfredii]|uniref:DNA repair protein RAD51 homolog 3 n=1 Tax=Penicillium alfredii TaxID=1506179 RepID=A0A9W9EGB2_9EURO|nr:uncharacterized protein NUU61_009576 [Penicillium alfredii]KAJ5081312.1 hypothetical protein NUU61_009576 [Penicillium alfredii]
MSIHADLLGLDSQDTLPVVSISASQSLNASASTRDPISTGLVRLDTALDEASSQRPGGIVRGQLTEVFGPPGVGKTSLALTIACNALRDAGKVVWIDTGSPVPGPRLMSMSSDLDNLAYFRAPTLPHLLALLVRPPPNFPPNDTALVVIDSVSGLFPAYFPNAAELKDRLAQGKITDKPQLQWLLNRKWNVAGELATHLARLAARNIAVLALNQTHTKIKGQPRATLHPVLAGGAWESNVQTRIMLYRDLPDTRLAEITKRAGRVLPVRSADLIVPFRIEFNGLHELDEPEDERQIEPQKPQESQDVQEEQQPQSSAVPDHTPSRKRKMDEVADSQDEDSDEEYQWMDEAIVDSV